MRGSLLYLVHYNEIRNIKAFLTNSKGIIKSKIHNYEYSPILTLYFYWGILGNLREKREQVHFLFYAAVIYSTVFIIDI